MSDKVVQSVLMTSSHVPQSAVKRLLQAFLFIMYMTLPPLVMYSTPCCSVYAVFAFMVISDRCFLGVYHRGQRTAKLDCYSLHQFSPDVIISALLGSFIFPFPLPLSLVVSFPLRHPSNTSLFFAFYVSWPLKISQHLCLLPPQCVCGGRGIGGLFIYIYIHTHTPAVAV